MYVRMYLVCICLLSIYPFSYILLISHTHTVDLSNNMHLGEDIDTAHDDLVQVAVSHEVRCPHHTVLKACPNSGWKRRDVKCDGVQ